MHLCSAPLECLQQRNICIYLKISNYHHAFHKSKYLNLLESLHKCKVQNTQRLPEMPSTNQTRKSGKRLERLICSGLRPSERLKDYADKLTTLAAQSTDLDMLRKKSRLLKALANETRLKMLRLLSIREMCVCELTIALDLTQPTASHHLNILQNVGLVRDRKEGKWVFYKVARPELTENLFRFLEFPPVEQT